MMVTPLYAGLLALWFLLLSYRVVQHRGHGFNLGDGGDATMLRLMRGHANFAEYVPLILLMMAMLELGHFSIYVIHALGLTLLVARVLHGIALSFRKQWVPGRAWGAGLTFLLLLVCGLLCVYQGLTAHWYWCCTRV